jgi:peptidoglycan-associated lipoprotein
MSVRWQTSIIRQYSQALECRPLLLSIAGICLSILLSGCGGSSIPVAVRPPATSPVPVPDTPAQPKPEIVEFQATPERIEKGKPLELSWQVKNATSIHISPEIGPVTNPGRKELQLDRETTYELTATGPGGEVSRQLFIKLLPEQTVVNDSRKGVGDLGGGSSGLEDVYFDYDRENIRDEDQPTLDKNATYMGSRAAQVIRIEAYCDERGSAEYNLAIGDRRASAVRTYLINRGIPPQRLKTISYGKEFPICTEATEDCWRRNRRVHFVPEDQSLDQKPDLPR